MFVSTFPFSLLSLSFHFLLFNIFLFPSSFSTSFFSFSPSQHLIISVLLFHLFLFPSFFNDHPFRFSYSFSILSFRFYFSVYSRIMRFRSSFCLFSSLFRCAFPFCFIPSLENVYLPPFFSLSFCFPFSLPEPNLFPSIFFLLLHLFPLYSLFSLFLQSAVICFCSLSLLSFPHL